MTKHGGARPYVRTTCPLDCWDACGALAYTHADGSITLKGDPEHPFSRGTVCGKLTEFVAFLQSDRRVTQPLLREGNSWREVSWDRALELCASELEAALRAGPGTILFDLGNGNCGLLRFSGQRFFRLLGVSITTGSLCDIAGQKGLEWTMGACLAHPPSDVLHSRAIIVWGRNPAVTNVHFWRFIQHARRAGATLAVVDVHPSATARRADLFLGVNPGTDVWLALGVARALLDLDLLDHGFLASHTGGWQEFLALARQITVPEAAGECGTEPGLVYELARLYGQRPTSTWLGMGVQHYRWGPTAVAFAAAPAALTGQLGIRGGGVSFFTGSLTPFQLDWIDPQALFPGPRTDRAMRKPVLADDLQSGPLPRVAWFQGSNAVKQAPASAATARALAGIRFKVAVEVRLSETASLCDLVLPAASFLEFEDVRGSFGTPWVGHMAPVAPPAGESRPEPDIYACLARHLGLERQYLEGGGPEGWLRRALLPLAGRGVTLEVLRERGGIVATGDNAYPELPFSEGRFATPDGRFRFPGHEDFQRYLRLRAEWQSEGTFPLQLITPKAPGRINSHPDTDARDAPRPPVARVHPQHVPAKAVEGETALLLTPLGQIRVRLLRDPAMKPGVVVVEQGGRIPDAIGINALIPATLSEDGEGACYYEARCRLEAPPG